MNQHNILKNSLLVINIMLLTACNTHQAVNGTAIDDMNVALHQSIAANKNLKGSKSYLPARISNALIPKTRFRSNYNNQHSYRRFDIAVKDVPAKTFFMGLVKGSSLSMAVSPDVNGNITLNLKNVTVNDVLQTLEDVYGYSYRQTNIGYQVTSNKIKTQMFTVNYLDVSRKGKSSLQVNSGQVSQSGGTNNSRSSSGTSSSSSRQQATSSIGNVETSSEVDFWKQLQKSLVSMIGIENEHSVTVNPLAGIVVVRAMPTELKQVGIYLDAVQNSVNRQVVLEAKILEVVLKHDYQMGIDWKIFGANLNSIQSSALTNQIFPTNYKADFHWNINNFTSTVQALSEQGNVQVLSSPRVSALNNQKAVIKVGNDEFYVTNVSTSNTQTVGGVTPTQDVELTPFFSGISLDVTPQIDSRGNVTLHIHPSVSEVTDQEKVINLGNSGTLTLPLARSTIRETDTVVHTRDGQVVVIGGLMKNQTLEEIGGLPFFANVPFFGALVKNTKQTSNKSELVILLKVTVVKRDWTKQLQETEQRVRGLKRGFHVGGYPGVFGTEGETPQKIGPVSGRFGRPYIKGIK